MGIGSRVPIQFLEITIATESGASREESYAVVADDFAVVTQRRGSRNPLDKSTGKEYTYVFTEVRHREDFTPTKTMLVRYKGLDLTITDVVLNEANAPYYYTITAETAE